MPILTKQIALVANVRQRIVDSMGMSQEVTVHNEDHGSSVQMFIGGSDLTTSNGLHIHSASNTQITIGPDDELYAIADGNAEIQVLIVKQD